MRWTCGSTGSRSTFLPAGVRPASIDKRIYYGGLYQKLVLTR
jgi:hypothetical protein